MPNIEDVEEAVKTAFSYNKDLSCTQLAFFGGSFTAIDKTYMLSLLEIGKKLTDKFGLAGIRISTRPDCIDEEILHTLKKYGVNDIELGAQSMFDDVLFHNDRGHTAQAVIKASNLIKEMGIGLGLQMMTGLYNSNSFKDFETAKALVNLKPKTLRVYPTVVFEDTRLCDLYRSGEYIPQTTDEAVETCTKIIKLCEKENVKIIRMGLHSSEQLSCAVAGVNHPSFMQLCQSKIFLDDLLEKLGEKGSYTIKVPPKQLSVAIGQKKSNVEKLKALGYDVKFEVS